MIHDDIAVIGMACRFPDASDYRALWANLCAGRSSVREIPPDRWHADRFYSPDPDAADTAVTKWGGFIDDADKFDAAFFRISPREAELMDPQQRILLELTWSCLEDAGYAPSRLRGSRTGVYVGVCNFDYKEALNSSGARIEAHLSTGTYGTLIPNRISYEFDFKGPSVPVDTACASSLVALHEAVHAIRRGDCAQAVVGGVSILCTPTYFVAFSKAGMLSPRGVCRTFDHRADGYVRGEGAGVVMVKPMAQALADGDRIWGVIKGSAVNHGGKVASVTSPSAFAQARVISDAIRRSGVAVDRIGYIEAHGTGTPKGDPIEIHGLTRAFQTLAGEAGIALADRSCGVGSIKTNIGHLEAAAGMAGLVKVLLAIHHRALPGLLHLEQLNPRIDLTGGPFYLVDKLQAWDVRAADGLRRAGVSSFGFGGVNAHVVVEEPPLLAARTARPPGPQVIVLSARTAERLRAYAGELVADRARWSAEPWGLADLARTLQRREAMEERVAFAVESYDALAATLKRLSRGEPARVTRGSASAGAERIAAFLPDGPRRGELEAWLTGGQLPELLGLWASGLAIDWAALPSGPDRPRLATLPSYPFERKRHWLAGPPTAEALWEVTAAWSERRIEARPERAAGPADRGAVWLTLLDAAGDAAIEQLAGDRAIALAVPADPDRGASWIDAWWTSVQRIQDAVTHHRPTRLVLVSSEAADYAAAMFATLQSIQKELELPAQWYAWDDRGCGPQRVRAVIDDALTGGSTGARRLRSAGDGVVCDERRWALQPLEPRRERPSWARGGVFWIPGGNGGIGRKIAAHLASAYGATVIVSGRSPAPAALPPGGPSGSIEYRVADCTQRRDLERVCGEILDRHGRLTGVIHAAGVLRDSSLFAKRREDVDEVLGCKIEGARLLDEVTRDCALECFLVFSSLTGLWGNPGQTDYAAANASLGELTRRRRDQVTRGERSGRSMVIHWPYWEAGGMRLTDKLVERLEDSFGMRPLADGDGLAMFDHALATRAEELAVTCGDRAVIEQALGALAPDPARPRSRQARPAAAAPVAAPVGAAPPAGAAAWLTEAIAELTGNPADSLSSTGHFADFGVDSLLLLKLLRRCNAAFGTALSALDLHNHPSIDELAALVAGAPVAAAPRIAPRAAAVAAPPPGDAVAIVGIDLQIAGAARLSELWSLVGAASRSPGGYPEDRWKLLPRALTAGLGREDCPGWFLPGALQFDHRLFGISPREAMLMDPQQRLVLHSVWRAIEHAGYARREFARRRTAVLLSIDAIDYEHLVHHDQTIDEFTGTGVSRYIAANRISHVFDLRGPSEPVDTACSSFFVGLGRAVEAMARGDVDQAIVAAVQMNLLPARFRVLRERGLLSAAGATRPFDHDGDGFVRSEGVGAVVLKPLVRALADRDHVYGVIRGVGVWHAGTAMGVTAPSSRAHQEAMARALAAGGVSVDSLGYIEAHGTGMPLGDASELDAIDQVFRAHGRDPARPCLLGAAKAALGHLEAASGIAALAKVVLVLEHGRAPGLAHLRTAARPFGAASGLRISATEQPLPEPADGTLRAGLLSYGLGGVSAFVVVERAPAPADPAPAPAQPELFVLSAQSPGVLQRYAEHILGFLAATPAVRIAQLVEAYRTGREAMGCRLAVIATTVAELRERLAAVIAGQPVDGAYASHGARAVPRTARAEPSELAHWVADRDLARLAVAYVTGADIPWGSPREPRAAFPSYPFDAERVFWISPRSAESGRAGRRERAGHGDRD